MSSTKKRRDDFTPSHFYAIELTPPFRIQALPFYITFTAAAGAIAASVRCLRDSHILSFGCASTLVTLSHLLYPSLNVLLCTTHPCMCARVCYRCGQYFSFLGRMPASFSCGRDDKRTLAFFKVKTRMQLERGKTSISLLGSFWSIIHEEGCAQCRRLSCP